MYELPDVLPDTELSPGTNVLISGPSLSGKRTLAYEILAVGANSGQGSIVVTTKDSAEKVLSAFADLVEGEPPIGVVDCVTKQRGIGAVEDDSTVKYASSPVDMTGIGIKLSEFLEEFHDGRGLTENRILLHSISTLLMYSNLQTVFRFLHVFTGRIQSVDGVGVYVIDSTAHDAQTMNTLKQLFDAVIELEGDADNPTIRTSGF